MVQPSKKSRSYREEERCEVQPGTRLDQARTVVDTVVGTRQNAMMMSKETIVLHFL
jgi:hypothetical protein